MRLCHDADVATHGRYAHHVLRCDVLAELMPGTQAVQVVGRQVGVKLKAPHASFVPAGVKRRKAIG